MALIIETGAAVKFQLEQQLLAEEAKLAELATELAEIEQKLSQAAESKQIDWLDRSRQLLQAQKHLTTNRLLNKSNRNLDDIHVPLGLIERKERPKVKEEPSPEQGSQLYQTEYTETKRFEHEAFLAEVVGKPVGGKHIAIIGEPGAGKTTILTKIGAWLIQQAEQQPPAPLVVAWISLADVGDRRLQAYLRDEWLQKVCEDNFDAAWEDWKRLRQQGRVWLLLDGLDEMSGDALAAIHRDLGQAWAQNLRVAITCRINQWETASNSLVNSFDVYRTLDYSYQTSQGDDQVKEFISKWFTDDPKVATQIRTELDAPGKERIKDLVKNPLRLTLLCASWEKDTQALPETQADLYRGFVNYLYKWKAAEFKDEVKLRQELDLALGELAKAGLNRQPINDGAVRRFRFTASEISKLWKDRSDALLPAAKNLGWLNVVGEEAKEDVYAFYHPTFQEYFAACAIDDWDYFLPRAHIDRPVPCQGEDKPTYRVFEKQWRQVILLWIGRSNITDELKEKFINNLTNFRGQENWFYSNRSYRMAAICVGEFKSSQQAKTIVEQVISLAFGYFNTNKNEWQVYIDPIVDSARDAIPFTHRAYAIDSLVRLLQRDDLNNLLRYRVTWALALGQIDVGNKQAISALVQLLRQPNLQGLRHSNVAEALAQIDAGNQEAISVLFQLLQHPNLSASRRSNVAEALGHIGEGDPETISALIQLLRQPDFDDSLRYSVVEALGEIGMGNRAAIAALVQLLQQSALSDLFCHYVIKALGQIGKGNPEAIAALVQLLEHPCLMEGCVSDAATALGRIGMANPEAIAALVQLIQHPYLSGETYMSVAWALGRIGAGNQDAIAVLVQFLVSLDSDEFSRYSVAEALGQIGVGNQAAIAALVKLLQQSDLSDSRRSDVAKALGQIGVGNQAAIAALVKLLQQSDLSDSRRSDVARVLGQIDVGNQAAIAALIQLLLQADLEDSRRDVVLFALGQIGIGNQSAIVALVQLLQQPALSDRLRFDVAKVLGQIDAGNPAAITALVKLLRQPDFDDSLRDSVAEVLEKILTESTMFSSIGQLKNCVTEEVYQSNFEQWQCCSNILFHCAQTLSYPKFHAAWYQP